MYKYGSATRSLRGYTLYLEGQKDFDEESPITSIPLYLMQIGAAFLKLNP